MLAVLVNGVDALFNTLVWIVMVVEAPTASPVLSASDGLLHVTTPPGVAPSCVQVNPLVATGVPTMRTALGSTSLIVQPSSALASPTLETVTV